MTLSGSGSPLATPREKAASVTPGIGVGGRLAGLVPDPPPNPEPPELEQAATAATTPNPVSTVRRLIELDAPMQMSLPC
jgi:hypothetical protein